MVISRFFNRLSISVQFPDVNKQWRIDFEIRSDIKTLIILFIDRLRLVWGSVPLPQDGPNSYGCGGAGDTSAKQFLEVCWMSGRSVHCSMRCRHTLSVVGTHTRRLSFRVCRKPTPLEQKTCGTAILRTGSDSEEVHFQFVGWCLDAHNRAKGSVCRRVAMEVPG